MVENIEKDSFLKEVNQCYDRINKHVFCSPLVKSKWLSELSHRNIFLKLESEQVTGSFKVRGAANKLFKLHEEDREQLLEKPVYTASSGNHALACCYVADKLGLKLKIFLSNTVAQSKLKKLRRYSCTELEQHGNENSQAEIMARKSAEKNNCIFISPYNDMDVITGQATIAHEIFSQANDIDAIVVPVGGGGLISGIALYAKCFRPDVKIIGAQPVNDPSMYDSVCAGRILEDNIAHPTFADGIAGRVEPGSVTFEIARKYVDEWILLTEDEIEKAVYDFFIEEGKLVEGAAGLAIGAVSKLSPELKNIAIVICGASIGVDKVKYLLDKYD